MQTKFENFKRLLHVRIHLPETKSNSFYLSTCYFLLPDIFQLLLPVQLEREVHGSDHHTTQWSYWTAVWWMAEKEMGSC